LATANGGFQVEWPKPESILPKESKQIVHADYWWQKLSAPEEKNESGWVPLKIAEDSSAGIDLHVGRITIAVKPRFDRTLLVEVLQTISALS
jgi:hypothetical protein